MCINSYVKCTHLVKYIHYIVYYSNIMHAVEGRHCCMDKLGIEYRVCVCLCMVFWCCLGKLSSLCVGFIHHRCV